MKKLLTSILSLLFLLLIISSCHKNDDPPVQPPIKITGFAPAQSFAGTDFIINGTGFDPSAANNTVKINGLAATVKSATATSLTVTIPDNALPGKVSVSTGTLSQTSDSDYLVISKSYTNVSLKTYQDGNTNQFDFEYDNNNRVILRKESFVNPISHLINLKGSAVYTYSTAGLLEKEVYTPLDNLSHQTMVEYSYTDGVLSADKRSTLDITNPGSPVQQTTQSHTYSIIGKQLLKRTTKDGTGTVIADETYTYSMKDGAPQFIRHITTPAGTSDETYAQYIAYANPYALLIPGAPQISLFLVTRATIPANPDASFTQRFELSAGLVTAIISTYKNGNQVNKATFVFEPKS
jgi:IPT/TIG domain